MEFTQIKGFGEKRSEQLKKSGIETVSDLLTVFPYSYVDLQNIGTPSLCAGKGTVTLLACVDKQPVVKYIRKGLFLTAVTMKDDKTGEYFECGWFNRKYIKNSLAIGKRIYVIGKIERYGKKLSISNPNLIPFSDDMPTIYPLYRPIKGIPSKVFLTAIDAVLKNVKANSYIDEETARKYGLIELNKAIYCLHRPSSEEELKDAQRSVALENLSCNMALYRLVKQTGHKEHHYENNEEKLNEFLETLPFKLTAEQNSALSEIIVDMTSSKKMNRLLQGDVGCGKTIVALSAMFYAAMSGKQSVLMSPTELLAFQHYETATRLFKQYGIKIAFLSSSLTAVEKSESLSSIADGSALVVIGTHSLIRDEVAFKNLSLIITDEQQRFGVKQRGALENKALNADYLVMTATPIPRTLALTLYGDLNQSEIRSVPSKKAEIETRFVPNGKIKAMLEYIKNKADCGEQTYMVCSRIDEDDELVSISKLNEYLLKTPLKKYIGVLHGQQPDAEKVNVMSRFACGDIKILITTSIIEVGIDVPKATSIIIFNAERYGLSQLHQLRGRVGRGEIDSFCFLLSDAVNDKVKERIEYFVSCKDGFALAEYDFRLRGAGDFLGTRQHGDSFFTDLNKSIIDTAKEISIHLADDESFKEKVFEGSEEGQLIFIEKLTMN